MNKLIDILHNIRPEFDFENSDNYIEQGMLDSFDIVTLVSELDASYNISIDGLDIVPQNFSNLQSILALVKNNGGNI